MVMKEPQGKKVILCIDDNPISLFTRQLVLANDGYAVASANNGKDGMRLAASISPDLVILDYRLPDIDGPEVARAIKDSDPKLPILLFSGDCRAPEDLTEYADGFLAKDSGPITLLGEVARLLREKGNQ